MTLTIKPVKLLINHEWVEAQNGKRFEVVNPATEQKITDVAEGDKADADSADRVARQAFEEGPWRKMRPAIAAGLSTKNCWPGLSNISLLKNPLRLTHCYTRPSGSLVFATVVLRSSFMTRMVKCLKLGREAEGLDFPPYPGELGKRIFDNVSKDAWKQWLEHQKMLVNENRLSLADKKARDYLAEQLEQHFFGSGADVASGYVPPSQK